MLSQPIFDDRALNNSLYQALIERFCDTLPSSIQSQLSECSFGFAPSPTGVKTFFIVSPSLDIAEPLLSDIDQIVERVQTLMIGVGQVALCIQPQNNPVETPSSSHLCHSSQTLHPQSMMCKIFPVNGEYSPLDD